MMTTNAPGSKLPIKNAAAQPNPAPANNSSQPNRRAALSEIRPEGSGRSGRSCESSSKSNTSFKTTPARYKQT